MNIGVHGSLSILVSSVYAQQWDCRVEWQFYFQFFLRFFWCGLFLKSLSNLLQYCFCFMFWVFWPWGMWNLDSPTRDWTRTPCIGRGGLSHWTTREVPLVKVEDFHSGIWGDSQMKTSSGHMEYRDFPLCLRVFSCVWPWDPVDCSPPGSSTHGILQARTLEWGAMPSFKGASRPRDQTQVSYISCNSRRILYHLGHLGSPFWLVLP